MRSSIRLLAWHASKASVFEDLRTVVRLITSLLGENHTTSRVFLGYYVISLLKLDESNDLRLIEKELEVLGRKFWDECIKQMKLRNQGTVAKGPN